MGLPAKMQTKGTSTVSVVSGSLSQDPSMEIREDELPLPSEDPGFRTVLALGAFGAGKSTLIRQLLGTAEEPPGFPATSTARTTIAPTEVICWPRPEYVGVVTFESKEEIRRIVREMLLEACHVAASPASSDMAIAVAVMTDKHQRIRLQLILGRYVDPGSTIKTPKPEQVEAQQPIQTLIDYIRKLVELQGPVAATDGADLDPGAEEGAEDRSEQFFDRLQHSKQFEALLAHFVALIEERVHETKVPGLLESNPDGWPLKWTFSSHDREEFLAALEVFTGNASARHKRGHMLGRLLTPLVNGVRVAGPFKPTWADRVRPLIYLDTQGLEHVERGASGQKPPRGGGSIPNSMVLLMRKADAILMLDDGSRPMDETSRMALRTAATMGAARKTFLVFNRVDRVVAAGGVGIEDEYGAAGYVQAALNSAYAGMTAKLGERRVNNLRSSMDSQHVFYLSHLDVALNPDDPNHEWTIEQLLTLVQGLATVEPAGPPAPVVPIFERAQLEGAMKAAGTEFIDHWKDVVGEQRTGSALWQTVWAMCARLADGRAEGWNGLYPAADLREMVQERLNDVLQRPTDWTVPPVEWDVERYLDEDVVRIIEALIEELVALTNASVIEKQRAEWNRAWAHRGGYRPTRRRAADIIGICRTAAWGRKEMGIPPLEDAVVRLLEGVRRPDDDEPWIEIRD